MTTDTTARTSTTTLAGVRKDVEQAGQVMLSATTVLRGMYPLDAPAVTLAEGWHAVKDAEDTCKGLHDGLNDLRGQIADALAGRLGKDDIVTIHGNARRRFTVSEYDQTVDSRVLTALKVLHPELVAEVAAMVTEDVKRPKSERLFTTAVRKLGFANPKKGQ